VTGLADRDAVMAKAAGENFPVAPRLLPGRLRRHLLAIYGFARLVDDLGDEAPGDRAAQLDRVERELELVWQGRPSHPVLVALAPTARSLGLPPEPFRRLIAANRRDQVVHRYPTFADLLAYCELSANPVGQLVLAVFGAASPERLRLADAVCTALQLTEHWQDVAEDLARGRVYLPQEDLAAFGCTEADLAAPAAGPAVRRLLRFQVDRTAALLDRGAALVGTLGGPARLAVAGFVGGGRAALAAIAAAGYDVLAGPPRPTRPRLAREALAALVRGR
jgi:squalene synthase HpnC